MTTRNATKPRGPERTAGREPARPRSARQEQGFEIVIDRAVEYALRLVPSGKVLGRYRSTREAWPAVVAAVDSGRALDYWSSIGSVQTALAARFRAASRSNTWPGAASASRPSISAHLAAEHCAS